jgi:hypothetical protein
MATWRDLGAQRPDLAGAGRDLLYQFGVGLAFLGTVRPDGGPRLHPICPLFGDDRLFAFLIPSPKRDDLLRDPRYALHSFPCPENEDAFYLRGEARSRDDDVLRTQLIDQFLAERAQLALSADDLLDQQLFELDIDACLLTRTDSHGDPKPRHSIWHAEHDEQRPGR